MPVDPIVVSAAGLHRHAETVTADAAERIAAVLAGLPDPICADATGVLLASGLLSWLADLRARAEHLVDEAVEIVSEVSAGVARAAPVLVPLAFIMPAIFGPLAAAAVLSRGLTQQRAVTARTAPPVEPIETGVPADVLASLARTRREAIELLATARRDLEVSADDLRSAARGYGHTDAASADALARTSRPGAGWP